MSIIIKNMEMPTRCGECLLAKLSPTGESLICDYMLSRVSWDERPFDCPLVPVPPHGRLIDADAFIAEQRHLYCENCARRKGMKNGKMKFVYDIGDAPCRACGYGDVLDDIDDAPTIIPADEGET